VAKVKKLNMCEVEEELQKKFGKKAVELGGYGNAKIQNYVSSGSWLVDIICGGIATPGIASPRKFYSWGPKHAGKTLLMISTMSHVHKAGGISVFLDPEASFYYQRAIDMFGWDPDRNIWVHADYIAQGFERMCETIILARKKMRKNKVKDEIPILCGWDGISFMETEEEFNLRTGKTKDKIRPATLAKELNRGIKMFNEVLAPNNVILWIINQPTTKWGSVSYQAPKGGEILANYCDVEMRHRKGPDIYFGDHLYGNLCYIKYLKNRVSGKRVDVLPLCSVIDAGIDDNITLMAFFNEKGIIKKPKKSTWYKMDTPGGEVSFQTEQQFLDRISKFPDLLPWMKKQVTDGVIL